MAVPETVGSDVLTGGAGAALTGPTTFEVAVALPAAFVLVTATASVLPLSALTMV